MKEESRPIAMTVEDNAHVSSYLAAMLDLADIETISTSSTEECLLILSELRNANKHIDVVILDGREPIGKGGLLVSQIKQFSQNTKILAIVRNIGARHKLLAAGADVAVTRPISGQTVVENVLMLTREVH
jgi:DNA-binding response OmpR family regulator